MHHQKVLFCLCQIVLRYIQLTNNIIGADDEVTTRVKGYIDAGTCNTVTFSDFSSTECGDSATSYYKEFTYNGKRVVITNNVCFRF